MSFSIFNRYTSLKSLFICCSDIVILFLSLTAGVVARASGDFGLLGKRIEQRGFVAQSVVIVLFIQFSLHIGNCYQFGGTSRNKTDAARLAKALALVCAVPVAVCFLFPRWVMSPGELFLGLCFSYAAVYLARPSLEAVWSWPSYETVAVLGSGRLARTVAQEICRRPDLNWRFVGFVHEDGPNDSREVAPVLGSFRDLEGIVLDQKISKLVVALQEQREILPIRALVSLRTLGISVEEAPSMLAGLSGRVWLDVVRPSWFVLTEGFRRSVLTQWMKRCGDVFVGCLGFAVSVPLMAIIAMLVRLDSKGPALYRQVRVGYRGRTFQLLKFRSMKLDAEAKGAQWAVEADPRVTRIGKYLRKFRLDELPQFINVLRGEMSLVGPRPERPDFTNQLRAEIPFYDQRHSVRPGITGLAQVRYRYCANVRDAFHKLEYDMFYLKHMSLWFDIAILFLTIKTVLLGAEWIDNNIIVPEFRMPKSRVSEEAMSATTGR